MSLNMDQLQNANQKNNKILILENQITCEVDHEANKQRLLKIWNVRRKLKSFHLEYQ